MKKQILIIFLAVFGLAANSCQQDSMEEMAATLQNEEPPFKTKAIVAENMAIKSSLIEKVGSNKAKINLPDESDFDFENIHYFEIVPTHDKKRDHEYRVYMIPAKESEDFKSTACYILECDGEISWAYIAETAYIAKNIQEISYYDIEGNPFFSARINAETKSVLSKFTPGPSSNGIPLVKTKSEGDFPYESVGDCTARCLADSYYDNGWWSVLLFGATIATDGAGYPIVAAYCWSACMDWWMFGIH